MFLTNHPAMFLDGYLIISDVHLGITYELYKSGVSMPSQVRSFLQRLHALQKTTKAKFLVINGDLKHKVPGTSWQEFKEIPSFLEQLDFDKIILVKGNHDGGIEKLIYGEIKKKVSIRKTFHIGSCLFTHGHRKLLKNQLKNIRTIVIGHNQPAVLFRDRMGASYIEQVWVRGPLKGNKKLKLIIMPSFNELAGAGVVNKGELLGPIAKKLDKKKAHLFLLDGTDLGTIEDLKVEE
ncbi:MAG: metallophosphoesterase [Candidatus Aenigmarchaeota archaeon]|nr:metallophosphoesterase [Candidatus Aenigmarchaeota archaeon]